MSWAHIDTHPSATAVSHSITHLSSGDHWWIHTLEVHADLKAKIEIQMKDNETRIRNRNIPKHTHTACGTDGPGLDVSRVEDVRSQVEVGVPARDPLCYVLDTDDCPGRRVVRVKVCALYLPAHGVPAETQVTLRLGWTACTLHSFTLKLKKTQLVILMN